MADITDALPPPKKCDNCNSRRVGLQKYTRRKRAKYVCYRCKASVYCHQGTSIPLGYMATAHTRYLRAKAHEAFDPIWKHGLRTRDQAYEWLARQLSVKPADAHIGRLKDAQLEKLALKSARYYRKLVSRERKRKALQHATDRRQRARAFNRKRGGKWKPTPDQ